MPLAYSEIVPYLMRRELVHPMSVLDSDLTVIDASRRNENYKVVSSRSPSYLIKQGAVSDGVVTVAREGAVYEYLRACDPDGELSHQLPRCYGYDAEQQVLVLELIGRAEDLRQYHSRLGQFPADVAAAIGTALGRLHRLTLREGHEKGGKEPGFWPWALSFHHPEQVALAQMSSANIQLIRIVQQYPDYQALLDQARSQWRPMALIHGDIKWDNFLLRPRPDEGAEPELVLVDWEIAGIGDPCWDAGAVFADYLSWWINSIPITGETPPERFAELARYPLADMQPAMRAFWDAYAREVRLTPATEGDWLLKTVQYCGARLVQTAYEYCQASVQFTGNVICLLQMSWNILERPREAAVQLLGLPWNAGWRL